MFAHAEAYTTFVCNMSINPLNPLGGHVFNCKKHSRKQGDVEVLHFPLSDVDGLVFDCFIACEFTRSSRMEGGWRNGQLHPNGFLQARA